MPAQLCNHRAEASCAYAELQPQHPRSRHHRHRLQLSHTLHQVTPRRGWQWLPAAAHGDSAQRVPRYVFCALPHPPRVVANPSRFARRVRGATSLAPIAAVVIIAHGSGVDHVQQTVHLRGGHMNLPAPRAGADAVERAQLPRRRAPITRGEQVMRRFVTPPHVDPRAGKPHRPAKRQRLPPHAPIRRRCRRPAVGRQLCAEARRTRLRLAHPSTREEVGKQCVPRASRLSVGEEELSGSGGELGSSPAQRHAGTPFTGQEWDKVCEQPPQRCWRHHQCARRRRSRHSRQRPSGGARINKGVVVQRQQFPQFRRSHAAPRQSDGCRRRAHHTAAVQRYQPAQQSATQPVHRRRQP